MFRRRDRGLAATDKDLPHNGPTEKPLSPRGSPTENLGSFGGRGEVGVNIIKRVFIEERVRKSAKAAALVYAQPSLEDLHHDLDEIQGIINERKGR